MVSADWRQREAEFRTLESDHPDTWASWDVMGWKLYGPGADRFDLLAAEAVNALGYSGNEGARGYWFSLLKTYLAGRRSLYLVIYGTTEGVVQPGDQKRSGDYGVMHHLGEVSANYCRELARQPQPPKTTLRKQRRTREQRLQSFVRKHKTTIAAVRRAAKVAKANMQQWRQEKLSDISVMSQRIEAVLNGRTPLDPEG